MRGRAARETLDASKKLDLEALITRKSLAIELHNEFFIWFVIQVLFSPGRVQLGMDWLVLWGWIIYVKKFGFTFKLSFMIPVTQRTEWVSQEER